MKSIYQVEGWVSGHVKYVSSWSISIFQSNCPGEFDHSVLSCYIYSLGVLQKCDHAHAQKTIWIFPQKEKEGNETQTENQGSPSYSKRRTRNNQLDLTNKFPWIPHAVESKRKSFKLPNQPARWSKQKAREPVEKSAPKRNGSCKKKAINIHSVSRVYHFLFAQGRSFLGER